MPDVCFASLQNNSAETRAEAKELLKTVKAPHPDVFFLDLNNVVDEDDVSKSPIFQLWE